MAFPIGIVLSLLSHILFSKDKDIDKIMMKSSEHHNPISRVYSFFTFSPTISNNPFLSIIFLTIIFAIFVILFRASNITSLLTILLSAIVVFIIAYLITNVIVKALLRTIKLKK